MNLSDKKEIIDLAEKLGATEDEVRELQQLIDEEDYDSLKDKFEFYVKLAKKRENEFFRIQQALYKKEKTEMGEELAESEKTDLENLRKLEALEDDLEEESIEEHYAGIDEDIDNINKETIEQLVRLREDYKLKAEKVAINKIQDKLR